MLLCWDDSDDGNQIVMILVNLGIYIVDLVLCMQEIKVLVKDLKDCYKIMILEEVFNYIVLIMVSAGFKMIMGLMFGW